MLKVVNTSQIREIDRLAIGEYRIPEAILMENAGIESFRYLDECIGPLDGKRIAIFCGKGNNGGDGFVLARHLHVRGVEVTVYLLAETASLKGNARLNMEAFSMMGGRIKEILSESDLKKHKIPILHADAVVDAILGTGLKSALDGVHLEAVKKINEWKMFCLAIDIPTGLSSDQGAIYGDHVKADATITFGFPKAGMVFYPAAESVGSLRTVNISFPPELLESSPCEAYLLDMEWVSKNLPERRPDAHKGSYGHVVVAGGATGMGGAVALASLSALKAGAGLVTAAVPHQLSIQFELGVKEVMSYHLGNELSDPENAAAILGFSEGKSVLLIGPGMGRGNRLTELMEKVVADSSTPLVIDADGLNNLAPKKDVLKKAGVPVVVTPHPGEMSRLTGMTSGDINRDRLKAARDFASEYNCVTVLKGARTVIAAPDGTAWINPTGNPNLATGGTGDALSGMIAGFMAQGVHPSVAAAVSAYIHGLAGDIYTDRHNPFSLSASDLLDCIPEAIAAVCRL